MNAQLHDFPKTPESQPKRKRTITLTGRGPISIIEEDWPVIAEGAWADSYVEEGPPWGWSIRMKLRRHVDVGKPPIRPGVPVRYGWADSYIVHAVFDTHDETRDQDPDANCTIRVGRVITIDEAAHKLCKTIREVGEELRERLLAETLKKYVTLVVDKVLAGLPPQSVA